MEYTANKGQYGEIIDFRKQSYTNKYHAVLMYLTKFIANQEQLFLTSLIYIHSCCAFQIENLIYDMAK